MARVHDYVKRANVTPKFGVLLAPEKGLFNPQSKVKITPKMGLILLLTWVVFTLFGVTLTLKVEQKF